ncbi:MAG: hypothetical protein IPM51_07580 [Sphingobacteriaceae bacterium]|nr:hypothetical protein [Sphingobacteriaceae bacterium]
MRKILTLSFILFGLLGISQVFTHSLAFTPKQNALQALAISSELKNYAKSDFSDVRLFDSAGRETPYFLVNETFKYNSTSFKEYEILNKEVGQGRYTRFTIHNPNAEQIGHVILNIVNSDAWKVCDITGSNDNKEWFSISDHIFLHHLYDLDNTNAYRSIHFPPVNYKYIKFEIKDLSTKPLNILKAGYFEGCISAGKLNEIKADSLISTEVKENKTTLIKVKFKNAAIINKIRFNIKAPNFFKREVNVYVNRTQTNKKKVEQYRDLIMSFELNSDHSNSFEISNFREGEFEIEIKNNDNPALEIEKIEFSQLQSYLVADFKENEKYILKAGDKKLALPVYDIAYFKDKISKQLIIGNGSELALIPAIVSEVTPVETNLWQEPWFMWACISLASFLLLIFSLKVLKDLKK